MVGRMSSMSTNKTTKKILKNIQPNTRHNDILCNKIATATTRTRRRVETKKIQIKTVALYCLTLQQEKEELYRNQPAKKSKKKT